MGVERLDFLNLRRAVGLLEYNGNMNSESLRLDANVIMTVLQPQREVNKRLLDLLRSFTAQDWSKPTIHPARDVKDLAAHLLHGSIRRVTAIRDGYRHPTPLIASTEDLIAFIQADNRDFMRGMKRVSPQILIELIAIYDEELLALFSKLNPKKDGLGVVWAGDRVSPNWFDIARWTKGMDREKASRQMQVVGNQSVVDALVSFVAIMA